MIPNQAAKHRTRDPIIVTGLQGEKRHLRKVINSHSTSNKLPTISHQEVIVDNKFIRKFGSYERFVPSKENETVEKPPPTDSPSKPMWIPNVSHASDSDSDFEEPDNSPEERPLT